MLKNIVSDVRKLVHAGTDCLQAVRKYYAFQNSLSAGESEYGQLNLEKIKLHIELDKTELARRKIMLSEEGAKKHKVTALQDMLIRKEATTEPTLLVSKEELEQVVGGLQAAMLRNPFPPPPPTLAKGKLVSPQEIVEELEEHIKELQDKLRNDTDAAAYQELANKLALVENRLQRAVRDCRAAVDARDALHAKNVTLTEQLTERDTQAHKNASIISQLRDNNTQLEKDRVGVEKALDPKGSMGVRSLVEHALWVMGKVSGLEDRLAHSNAQEVRLNVEVQHLKKALAQATGVPILSATQQQKE